MQIISKSVNDTIRIGRVIAKRLKKGDIICLFGQFGSGKTILTKGIALGLGIKSNIVVSPSFVLIREYNSNKLPLYHFDLYRLKREKDILDLGYEEYLYDEGVTVIEWADRLRNLLPQECLKIELFIHSRPQNCALQGRDGARGRFSIPPKEPRALARVGSIKDNSRRLLKFFPRGEHYKELLYRIDEDIGH